MKHKTIAFFAPNLSGGGAERVVSVLAAQFSEEGYKVDLILAEAIGPYLEKMPSSVHVIDLKSKRVLLSLPKLIKYLRKEQPSILFSSQMHSSIVALWATKLAGVSTQVFIRQPTMLNPSYEEKSWKSKLVQKILLWSVKSAVEVIVTSKAMAKEFIDFSKIEQNKVEVIYNPVPIEFIREQSLEPLSHPWFKSNEPPVILAVGRLVTVKDFQTLVKAFALVRNETPARLMILGEGPLRIELENLIDQLGLSDHVQIPGFVSNPYQYMKYSKVFVLSSLWEGFPNGMVEAMACGTAIVATDCEGGASEILEHGKWGELVPVGNEVLMAKAIVKSIVSERKSTTFERVDDFSVDVIFEKYCDVFNK